MRKKAKLKKYNPTMARLWDVILGMSQEQQNTLLKHANDLVKGDRRLSDRRSCRLKVDFATADRTHKGYITNISRVGVFIEAKAPGLIGDEVLLVFKAGPRSKIVKLRGEIAHATRWGLGVEFIAKGPAFNKMIGDLIRIIN